MQHFMKWNRMHKRRNQGISLIEVIISLLILMIIFVPLLSSFLSSAKVTVSARNRMYASSLADNVMEAVKTLGIEGTALQIYGDSSDFLLGKGTALTYSEDLSGGVSSSVKTDGTGNKFFDSSRKTKPYAYQLEGVQEGTGTYDVKITFSSASYTSPETSPSVTPAPAAEVLPNDYKYADLSAFNSVSTALIDPRSSGTDYDYLAKAYFKQLHESYYYDEWVNACAVVNSANDVIYRAYEQACDEAIAAGNPTPAPPSVTPTPTPKATLNDTALNDRITKTTTVEVTKITDGLSGVQRYNMNSHVTYTFNNIFNNGGTPEGVCADPSNNLLTRNYAGYCDNVQSIQLESIFFMYTPFISVSDLTQEKIKVVNQTADALNIYLVVQAPAGSAFPSHLKVELSGTPNTLNLSSQAILDVSGTSQASTSNFTEPSDRLLKELSPNKGRIYTVTVNVYESGSGFSKLLQTLKSTVISE